MTEIDIVERLRAPEVVEDDCTHIALMQEAAAEIERLRADKEAVIHYLVPTSVFWANDPHEWPPSPFVMPREVEIELKQAAAPEPWGSPYAMNPENWK
jgi:hypothetical protein